MSVPTFIPFSAIILFSTSNSIEKGFSKWVFYSHSGDVFTREGIGGITYEQTGLTHSPEDQESRGC